MSSTPAPLITSFTFSACKMDIFIVAVWLPVFMERVDVPFLNTPLGKLTIAIILQCLTTYFLKNSSCELEKKPSGRTRHILPPNLQDLTACWIEKLYSEN